MADKLYSIGSVSRMLNLRQSVLRYWEDVFDELAPYKTPGGTRKYSEKDLAVISLIRDLLYQRKFTIAGAKRYLKDRSTFLPEQEPGSVAQENLQPIVSEIESIINYLNSR